MFNFWLTRQRLPVGPIDEASLSNIEPTGTFRGAGGASNPTGDLRGLLERNPYIALGPTSGAVVGIQPQPDQAWPQIGRQAPVWDGTSTRPYSRPDAIIPAAWGDLRCEGASSGGGCSSGGDYGTTAMYQVEGRNLCHKCAVKQLGFEDEPSSELPRIMRPFLLGD